jgi:hypothetical protein
MYDFEDRAMKTLQQIQDSRGKRTGDKMLAQDS